jgi:hypothetical protein
MLISMDNCTTNQGTKTGNPTPQSETLSKEKNNSIKKYFIWMQSTVAGSSNIREVGELSGHNYHAEPASYLQHNPLEQTLSNTNTGHPLGWN